MVLLSILQKIFNFNFLIYKVIKYVIAVLLLGLIVIYRYLVSPFFASTCRYNPTCSTYGLKAIKMHGPFLGGYLTIKRILKCNPWGGYGYDPVPTCKYKINRRK